MIEIIQARLAQLRAEHAEVVQRYNELEANLHELGRVATAIYGGIQELEELERQLQAQETGKEKALVDGG